VFEKVGDKTCLYDKVVHQIRTAILKGDFKAGDRLPSEKELARSFMVSRGIIREATKALSTMGLIEIKHGYGIFVSDFNGFNHNVENLNGEDLVTSIFEVRKLLETGIACWVAKKASEEKIDRIAQIISTTEKRKDMLVTLEQENRKFHVALAEATGNQILKAVISHLFDLFSERLRNRSSPRISARDIDEHKKIFEAIAAKDQVEASRAMYTHLNNVEEEILKNLG